MDTRTLGGTLEVSALGLGCMGMSQAFGAAATTRRDDHVPPRGGRPRRHLLRHRRGLRAVPQRGAGGRGAASRSATEVVIATKFGFAFDEDGNQTGVTSRPERHPRGGRRVAAAAAYRHASTCSTSTASTPTSRSRTSPAPSRSSSRPARCATSACPRPGSAPSAAPTPSSPSRRCRASTPCSGASPRTRSCPSSRSSASASSPSARSVVASSPARSPPTTEFGEGDIRATLPRFEREALEANLALVDLVTGVAERKGATVGQVALAWLLAQQPWIVPIPGTRRLERLDENLGSADLELTAEDLAELDARLGERAGPGRSLPGGHAADDRPLTGTGITLAAPRTCRQGRLTPPRGVSAPFDASLASDHRCTRHSVGGTT